MFWKKLIIFTFLYLATAFENDVMKTKRSDESNILKLIAKTSTIFSRSPNQVLACYDYYGPLMKGVMEEYEKDCRVCNDKAEEQRIAADATTVEQRKQLDIDANKACEDVIQCKSADSPHTAFICYIDGGSASSKALSSLSSNASAQLVVFQKTLRNIYSEELICLSESKQKYETEWNRINEEFSDCINGLIEVPTQAPPTTSSVDASLK